METEYSLIAIFGKEDFVLDFMKKKKKKSLKALKSLLKIFLHIKIFLQGLK